MFNLYLAQSHKTSKTATLCVSKKSDYETALSLVSEFVCIYCIVLYMHRFWVLFCSFLFVTKYTPLNCMSIPLPFIEELATYYKYVCYCSTNKHLIHMEQFVSTFCSCEKQKLGLSDYRNLL